MQVMGGFQGYGLRVGKDDCIKNGEIYFWSLTNLARSKKSGFEKKTFLRFQFDMTQHCFLSFVCQFSCFFSLRILDLEPCRRWLLWPECLEVGGWTWTAVVEILQWLDCYCLNTCLHLYKRLYGHIYIYACICMKQKDHRKSALGCFFNSRVDIPVDIPKCTPP